MAACQHRPEDGACLVPCADPRVGRVCLCSCEVRDELAARLARVPDSAREAGAA